MLVLEASVPEPQELESEQLELQLGLVPELPPSRPANCQRKPPYKAPKLPQPRQRYRRRPRPRPLLPRQASCNKPSQSRRCRTGARARPNRWAIRRVKA